MTEEGLGLRTADPAHLCWAWQQQTAVEMSRPSARAHIPTIWVEHGRIVALSHGHSCGNCLRRWR